MPCGELATWQCGAAESCTSVYHAGRGWEFNISGRHVGLSSCCIITILHDKSIPPARRLFPTVRFILTALISACHGYPCRDFDGMYNYPGQHHWGC
eukprot:759825-Hanusia_phi.AAC.1